MKFTNKRIISFAVVLLFIGVMLSGCGAEKSSTIGVVDMQKVMTDNPKVKQMQEKLNTKGKALTEQLDKDKAELSAEEYKKKEEVAYADFMTLKQGFEQEIDVSIKKAMEDIAKEKKLGAVVYKQGMAWGGIDVTEDVIKKLQ